MGTCPPTRTTFFHQLSETALASFARGSGNELVDAAGRPAKMRALHSSSALVVNVFDYFAPTPDKALHALGLPIEAIDMRFEAQFETGLGGNPPNLDLYIKWANGTLLGVESKFMEWLTPKPAGKEYFTPKYFPEDRALWGSRGMTGCQAVAQSLHAHELHFRFLDAAQLLKHALGLVCTGKKFELFYLYYDWEIPEADVHRREVAQFSALIGQDFPFHSGTYQEVFQRIQSGARQDDALYVDYLKTRYFS